MALALTITQMGCQAPHQPHHGGLSGPHQLPGGPGQHPGATQLISALGDPLYRLKMASPPPGGLGPGSE